MLQIYKASAGSGKTYALTEAYLKLLFDNSQNYKHTLAVTFTNKASGEMKERIIKALFELSFLSESSYLSVLCNYTSLSPKVIQSKAELIMCEILHNYSFFFIETIDSFFQRVIRNFAKELGLNSYYGLELDLQGVLQQAVQNLFLNLNENPELQSWLTAFAEHKIEEGKGRDVQLDVERQSKILFSETFMVKNSGFVDKERIVAYFNAVAECMQLFRTDIEDLAKKSMLLISDFQLEISDFNGGSRSFMGFLPKIIAGDFSIPNQTTQSKILDIESWASKKSEKRTEIFDVYHAGLGNLLQQILELLLSERGVKYRTAVQIASNKFTTGILQSVQNEIDDYCKKENIFLISNTNFLLQSIINQSDAPFIYEKIGCYIKNLMIDEFQDTSQMQWKNFLPLIQNSLAEGGNTLVVGDVKQSIYRFRNGDWNLLQSQVYNDFRGEIEERNLNKNWRSRANVIAFNNAFFKRASQVLQQTFVGKMESLGLEVGESFSEIIELIYTDVAQELPPNGKSGGVVRVYNYEQKADDDVKGIESLEMVTLKVVELFERGYKPEDIVFLTRGKREIINLVNHFNAKKTLYPQYANAFTVVSNEALLLQSSNAVQFVVAYLQWIETPFCKFTKSFLLCTYSSWLNSKNVHFVENLQQYNHLIGDFPKISKNASLYEVTEAIISHFNLQNKEEEVPFLLDFQDIVYGYSNKNYSSISMFLNWWEENAHSFYLKQQETTGFMRAMTIHKSKGLQFPIVFLPFASWQYQMANNSALFSTHETDFSEIPLVSIGNKKELAYTQFANQYVHEELQVSVDSINLLYVACTRAEDELYMYVPTKADARYITPLIHNTLDLLHEIIPNSIVDENGVFCVGDVQLLTQAKSDIAEASFTIDYPVFLTETKLLPIPEALSMGDRITQSVENRNYGLAMHKILEYTITATDLLPAVERCIIAGLIKENEKDNVILILQNSLRNPVVSKWFDGTYNVLVEQSILLPNNDEKRPDRIMIHKNEAIIVDYKFTKMRNQSYNKQVNDYMNLLAEMGYTVKGYVWYVILNEVDAC